MKIFVLSSRWSHMGDKSGFPLCEVLRSVLPPGQIEELPIPLEVPPIPMRVRIARKLGLYSHSAIQAQWPKLDTSRGCPWAKLIHRDVARKALAMLHDNTDAVLLLPVADEQYCIDFACASSDIKRRLFLCMHQPPATYRLHWPKDEFNSLGGIICLGEVQASYFKSITQSQVYVIRHGVRHDFFRPPADSSVRKGDRLLFVGQWLRDFATLSDSMPIVWSKRPDVRLDCIIPLFARYSEPLQRLAMDERVSWHCELTDDELRDFYQTADLLFLPVLDAVANNAMLEALASGLPIISTDINGLAEYVPNGAGLLCPPRDVRSHAAAVISMLEDAPVRMNAGVVARETAVANYDWQEIGHQLATLISCT